MCFRPADADTAGPRPCPHCGKMVFPSDGILPKKCPFCREELEGEAPLSTAPNAPSAPGAPKAPKAPNVPVTSSTLGVSEVPAKPNAS